MYWKVSLDSVDTKSLNWKKFMAFQLGVSVSLCYYDPRLFIILHSIQFFGLQIWDDSQAYCKKDILTLKGQGIKIGNGENISFSGQNSILTLGLIQPPIFVCFNEQLSAWSVRRDLNFPKSLKTLLISVKEEQFVSIPFDVENEADVSTKTVFTDGPDSSGRENSHR